MFGPTRVLLALRTDAPPGLVAAAAAIAAMFAATPFAIPEVAARYEVTLGVAASISVAQVGGFTLANFVAGRRLKPSRRLFVWTTAALVVANVLSAVNPWYVALIALRITAGVAAGLLTWLAWVDAMADRRIMRDVAGAGPMAVLLSAPLFGWLATLGDDRALYAALGVITLPVLLMRVEFTSRRPVGRLRMSASRSNVVLLGALALLTFAGSSLYVFSAVIGTDRVGIDPVVISLGFSGNALAGFIATRLRTRGGAAPWVLVVAGCAAAVAFAPNPVVFLLGLAGWGFAFWMIVPEVFRQIVAWSLAPAERVGDAQALMALGRMLGPALGGVLVGTGSFTRVGVEAVAGLVVAAVIMFAVERYRRRRHDRRPAGADRPTG